MNLEQKQQQLTSLQRELTLRIDAIKSDFRNKRSADFSEQATEQENEEVLVRLVEEAEAELRMVNAAINKLSEQEFGVCENCGEDIAEARLDAIPFTPFCIECA
jgi:RNA polymerase-binding protein DksA